MVLANQAVNLIVSLCSLAQPSVDFHPVFQLVFGCKIGLASEGFCKACKVHALLEGFTAEPADSLIFVSADEIQEGLVIQKDSDIQILF